MAVRTLPVEQELVVYSGTDMIREFRWLPDGRRPQDFTGWTGWVHIGQVKGRCLLHLSTDSSGVTLSGEGIIKLRITAVQSAALSAPNLIYTCDLRDPAGVVTRFLRGRLIVVRDVGVVA